VINKQIMLNNIPAHNHTLYSYLQALLTDRHKVSALCSQFIVSIHTTACVTCTDNHLCNSNEYYRSNEVTVQGQYMYGIFPGISVKILYVYFNRPPLLLTLAAGIWICTKAFWSHFQSHRAAYLCHRWWCQGQ